MLPLSSSPADTRRTAEVDKRVAEAMDDYLRLRHKAKQAHAASAEEQRQCAEAREKVSIKNKNKMY